MADIKDEALFLINRPTESAPSAGDEGTYTIRADELADELEPDAFVLKPQIITPSNGAGLTILPESNFITAKVDNPDGTVTLTVDGEKDLDYFTVDMDVKQDTLYWADSGVSTSYRVCFVYDDQGNISPSVPAALIGINEDSFLTLPNDGVYHPYNMSYADYYNLPTHYNNNGIIDPPTPKSNGWVLYDTGRCKKAGQARINPGDNSQQFTIPHLKMV